MITLTTIRKIPALNVVKLFNWDYLSTYKTFPNWWSSIRSLTLSLTVGHFRKNCLRVGVIPLTVEPQHVFDNFSQFILKKSSVTSANNFICCILHKTLLESLRLICFKSYNNNFFCKIFFQFKRWSQRPIARMAEDSYNMLGDETI